MNHSKQMVRFTCPQCGKRLKSPARNGGRRCRCPRCSIRMEIPGQLRALAVKPVVHPVAESYPVVVPARQEKATVPLKLSLPQNLGGMETKVSQGTANSMAKVVTGGFLVVLGVVVAGMFGIRVPKA
jgi:DNA-directed RNA polymerase subunit RPC12/RpoP